MNVIVWSKPMCPACEQSKQLLTAKGIVYEERKIGDGWTKEQLLESVPTARSVPQIFVDGDLVGGFNELKQYLQG